MKRIADARARPPPGARRDRFTSAAHRHGEDAGDPVCVDYILPVESPASLVIRQILEVTEQLGLLDRATTRGLSEVELDALSARIAPARLPPLHRAFLAQMGAEIGGTYLGATFTSAMDLPAMRERALAVARSRGFDVPEDALAVASHDLHDDFLFVRTVDGPLGLGAPDEHGPPVYVLSDGPSGAPRRIHRTLRRFFESEYGEIGSPDLEAAAEQLATLRGAIEDVAPDALERRSLAVLDSTLRGPGRAGVIALTLVAASGPDSSRLAGAYERIAPSLERAIRASSSHHASFVQVPRHLCTWTDGTGEPSAVLSRALARELREIGERLGWRELDGQADGDRSPEAVRRASGEWLASRSLRMHLYLELADDGCVHSLVDAARGVALGAVELEASFLARSLEDLAAAREAIRRPRPLYLENKDAVLMTRLTHASR